MPRTPNTDIHTCIHTCIHTSRKIKAKLKHLRASYYRVAGNPAYTQSFPGGGVFDIVIKVQEEMQDQSLKQDKNLHLR